MTADHSLKRQQQHFWGQLECNTILHHSFYFLRFQPLLQRFEQMYKAVLINLLAWAKTRKKNWALLCIDLYKQTPCEKMKSIWWDAWKCTPSGVGTAGTTSVVTVWCPKGVFAELGSAEVHGGEVCYKTTWWQTPGKKCRRLDIDGRDLVLKVESYISAPQPA